MASEDDRFEYIRRHGSAPPEHPKEEGLSERVRAKSERVNDADKIWRESMSAPSSSNWQIRIEALRAAATICTAASFYRTGDYAGDTLTLAKRFERYLESGE